MCVILIVMVLCHILYIMFIQTLHALGIIFEWYFCGINIIFVSCSDNKIACNVIWGGGGIFDNVFLLPFGALFPSCVIDSFVGYVLETIRDNAKMPSKYFFSKQLIVLLCLYRKCFIFRF